MTFHWLGEVSGEVTCPVALAAGLHSRTLAYRPDVGNVEAYKEVAQRLGECKGVATADVGHNIPQEAPAFAAQLIATFLASARASGAAAARASERSSTTDASLRSLRM